jgi:hypothetical protein
MRNFVHAGDYTRKSTLCSFFGMVVGMSPKRLFLMSLVLVLTSAAYGEQNVPVNVPGGGASDLLNVTNIPAALDGQVDDSGVRFTCTDSYGRSTHRGEALFDDCMKQKRAGDAPKAAASPIVKTN